MSGVGGMATSSGAGIAARFPATSSRAGITARFPATSSWAGIAGRFRATSSGAGIARRFRAPVAALLLLAACGDGGGARAQSGVVIDPARVPAFSGDTAYSYIVRQVSFGPRVPGTSGHAAQLAWMQEFLASRADTVTVQRFVHEAGDGNVLEMANVFAQFRPDQRDRVLLVAHWDTRPRADMERDPARRGQPIPGANDGASGVAVLLEMANVLSRHSPPIGVDLLFVDGEDYGPDGTDMYLGAKHFARNQPNAYRPLYGIVVDMVADQSPVFPIEGNSRDLAPEVVERVWSTAEQLGLSAHFPRRHGGYILDDHLPLNEGGIRSIVIIDFDYGPGNSFWHTHADAIENTGPTGPAAVGRVLTALIYNGG